MSMTKDRQSSNKKARKQIELVSNSVVDFSCLNSSHSVCFEDPDANGARPFCEVQEASPGNKACPPSGKASAMQLPAQSQPKDTPAVKTIVQDKACPPSGKFSALQNPTQAQFTDMPAVQSSG